jgi:hypothetical protein
MIMLALLVTAAAGVVAQTRKAGINAAAFLKVASADGRPVWDRPSPRLPEM